MGWIGTGLVWLVWLIDTGEGRRRGGFRWIRGARIRKKKLRVKTYMYDGNRDLLVVIKNILD